MGRRGPARGQNGKTAAAKKRASSRNESFSRASSSSSIVLCDDEDSYVPTKRRSFAAGSSSHNNSYGETPREDKYHEPTKRTTGRERSSVNYAALNSPPRHESLETYDNDYSVAAATPSSKASYSQNYTETTPDSTSHGNGYSSYSNNMHSSSVPKARPGPATVKLTSAAYASKHTGPQAEDVIGNAIINGELHLLIKWKDSDEADMIPAKVARYKYPSVVIQFYEIKFRQQLKEKETHQPSHSGRKSFP